MGQVLLCLHGWGGSKDSFTELKEELKNNPIEFLIPNLPGFGSEPEPRRPWTNDDYADWVEQWLKNQLSIVNCLPSEALAKEGQLSIIGHSHGGRIAIVLAARKSLPIAHLYLCAPAGIRRRNVLKRSIGLIMAKTGKLLLSLPLALNRFEPLARRLLYRLLRTHDYEQASPLMRQTMVQVTSEDLRPLLKKIDVPTDIFWGTDDQMTPYADAAIVKAGIKGSVLHTYHGVRHRVHRGRAKEIAEIIRKHMTDRVHP